MKLTSLSASRLREWWSCQLQYAYKHHDKLAPDVGTSFKYIGLGHVIHHCYAKAVIERKHPSKFLREAMDMYAHELHDLDQENRSRIPAMLNSWDVIEPLTHGDQVWVESEFWVNCDIKGEVINHGLIDLLIRRGDYFIILDWKTVKPHRQSKEENLQHDEQLCLYAIATSMLFDVPIQNVRTGLFYVENARLIMTDWSVPKAQNMLNRFIGAGYDIIDTDRSRVVPNPNKKNCRFCDYKNQCSFGIVCLKSR
jgi:hypothetical protein